MLRIVIGLINYSGVACGINFEKSIAQNVPEDMDLDHPQVKRLLALFPGTTAEEVGEGTAIEPEKVEKVEKIVTPPPPEVVETVEELEEVEETPDAEVVDEDVGEEVEEEVEEVEEPEDQSETCLTAGDDVLAHYKGEFRKGKVVSVLESGVVRVNLDGDDAQYRVLDDDKVSKLDGTSEE